MTIWPALELRDDEGRVIAIDALAVVFFVDVVHEECVGRIADAIEQVAEFAGPGLLRYYVDDDGNTLPLTRTILAKLIDELRASGDEGEGGLHLLGDDVHESGCNLYYFGQAKPNPRRPEWRNEFSFRLPRAICERIGLDAIANWVRSLAETVPFSSAYASPCIAYSQDPTPSARLTRRYPGFDVAKPGALAATIGDHLAGVYWLSYAGQRLSLALHASPGWSALAAHGATVTPLANGTTEIRLGRLPAVGDINRHDNLPAYRDIARLLEMHLYMPGLAYFREDDGMTADVEATRAWHRRFLD